MIFCLLGLYFLGVYLCNAIREQRLFMHFLSSHNKEETGQRDRNQADYLTKSAQIGYIERPNLPSWAGYRREGSPIFDILVTVLHPPKTTLSGAKDGI